MLALLHEGVAGRAQTGDEGPKRVHKLVNNIMVGALQVIGERMRALMFSDLVCSTGHVTIDDMNDVYATMGGVVIEGDNSSNYVTGVDDVEEIKKGYTFEVTRLTLKPVTFESSIMPTIVLRR